MEIVSTRLFGVRTPPWLVAVLLAGAGACSAQTLPGAFPHAYAHADCAPWDGPAVRFVLTRTPVADSATLTPGRPMLDLAVYTTLARSRGRLFRVRAAPGAREDSGGATWCPAEGPCEPAGDGWIRVTDEQADTAVSGSYELHFAGHGTERGRFTATWRRIRIACG